MLDPIHHSGLRIALGAFKTSPVKSLYAEAEEPSLDHRRLKLSMNYMLRLKSCPENPAYRCVFEPSEKEKFEARSLTPPLGHRMKPHFESSNIDHGKVEDITRYL